MTIAPHTEGYETTVDASKEFLSSGKFITLGGSEKASKVMVDLSNHLEPLDAIRAIL